MAFDKSCGRLRVAVSDDGARMHDYGHGVEVSCPTGWNDSCPIQTHTLSVDELHDLQYLIGRALASVSPTPLTTDAEGNG